MEGRKRRGDSGYGYFVLSGIFFQTQGGAGRVASCLSSFSVTQVSLIGKEVRKIPNAQGMAQESWTHSPDIASGTQQTHCQRVTVLIFIDAGIGRYSRGIGSQSADAEALIYRLFLCPFLSQILCHGHLVADCHGMTQELFPSASVDSAGGTSESQ